MFTRAGWGTLGAATVLVAAGWILAYPAILLLGVTCAVALVAAVVWVGVRPSLEVGRYVRPQRVTRDDPAMGVLTVTNNGRRRTSPLQARDWIGRLPLDVVLPRLAPGDQKETTYVVPTHRRGVHQIGPLTLTRTDPLGLVRWTRGFGAADTVWVYPRPHAIAAVPSGHRRSLDGPAADTAPHGSITFNTLREYATGDDLRHVHWRSSAHAGTLMVKQHVDVSLPHTTIVIDTHDELYEEDTFEAAIDAVASIVLASAGAAYPIRILTTSGLRVGGQARTDLTRIFDCLAVVEMTPRGHLIDAVDALNRERVGDTLVLVTGRIHPADLALLNPLSRRFDRILVVAMRRPDDPPLPSTQGVSIFSVTSGAEFAQAWNRLLR
ncbi:MAG: DUF58 domain-containing protein [Thermoleophilia bacterium]|nr:DUF58 domain-containing protein [Thermoleophilia bacterium]